jgi:hypothetical protein
LFLLLGTVSITNHEEWVVEDEEDPKLQNE